MAAPRRGARTWGLHYVRPLRGRSLPRLPFPGSSTPGYCVFDASGVVPVCGSHGRQWVLPRITTVSPRHVTIEALPERARSKLPRYPVPVLGLARLAVDRSARSQGIAAGLLRFVLELAARMAEETGCAGVVVDAKPGATGFYTKYGFVPLDLIEGQSDSRPQPVAMWLPIQMILDALDAGQ